MPDLAERRAPLRGSRKSNWIRETGGRAAHRVFATRCVFRAKSITENAPCRSGNTVDADQRKRRHADQFSAAERNR
jgi:hypothetical protein